MNPFFPHCSFHTKGIIEPHRVSQFFNLVPRSPPSYSPLWLRPCIQITQKIERSIMTSMKQEGIVTNQILFQGVGQLVRILLVVDTGERLLVSNGQSTWRGGSEGKQHCPRPPLSF